MEHPNSKCRIAQAEYLSRLPEEERENKARDIRIGNASYIYHQQAVPIQENRLIMYYKEWLEGLPPNISRHMRMLGFEACKTMIPFTRYVNERNAILVCVTGCKSIFHRVTSTIGRNFRKKQVRQHFNPIPFNTLPEE